MAVANPLQSAVAREKYTRAGEFHSTTYIYGIVVCRFICGYDRDKETDDE